MSIGHLSAYHQNRSFINKIGSLLKSRRFWLMVAGVGVAITAVYKPGISDMVNNVILVIGSWVVGDSIRSTGS